MKATQILADIYLEEAAQRRSQEKVHTLNSKLAECLKSERLRAGISLRAMARRIGCSCPFLSNMERGFQPFLPVWAEKVQAVLAEQTEGLDLWPPTVSQVRSMLQEFRGTLAKTLAHPACAGMREAILADLDVMTEKCGRAPYVVQSPPNGS